MSFRISTALLAAAFAAPLFAQSTEATLDLVVRDRRGKAIREVPASAVELSDNGKKVPIKSLRLIDGDEMVEGTNKTTLEPMRKIRLATFVIEKVGLDVNRQIRSHLTDIIKTEVNPNHYYAIAFIYRQLHVLQPFTTDKESLIKAVEFATNGNVAQYAAYTSRVREELKKEAALSSAAVTDADVALGEKSPALKAALAGTMLRMMRYDGVLDESQNARTTIAALDSLASGQAAIPGRKAMAYLSWGIYVPDSLDVPFQSMVSRANSSHVAIYGMNVTGGSSSGGDMRAGLRAIRTDVGGDAAQTIDEQIASGVAGTAASGPAQEGSRVRAGESVENAARANTDASLRTMSESTGGLFVTSTNDFRGPVRQMLEDLDTYHEVTYDPGITDYDGSFRKTSVKVGVKDTRVRSRSGYFALPPSLNARGDLQPYEIPLYKALAATPLPRDVEFRSAAIRLRAGADEITGSVLLEVPMKNLTFQQDKAAGTYKARLSMIAQLRDAAGNVVKKFTQDLPLAGKLEQVPALQGGNFIFKEEFSLPAGRYTLDAAVVDSMSGKVGARRSSFLAAARPAGIGVSSVSMVRTYQPGAKLEADEPFQYQGGKITPTLNATVKAVKGVQMSMFFTAYPDKAIADKPVAQVQYWKDGQMVGAANLDLPAADGEGRIRYVLSSPADTMPPGTYEVKIILKQGATSAEERVFVTIEG